MMLRNASNYFSTSSGFLVKKAADRWLPGCPCDRDWLACRLPSCLLPCAARIYLCLHMLLPANLGYKTGRAPKQLHPLKVIREGKFAGLNPLSACNAVRCGLALAPRALR